MIIQQIYKKKLTNLAYNVLDDQKGTPSNFRRAADNFQCHVILSKLRSRDGYLSIIGSLKKYGTLNSFWLV